MLQVPSKAVAKVEIISTPELQRFLHRLPKAILDRLTPAELSAYAKALEPERSPHWIDFKASLPISIFGVYVAVMAGRERRSWERLRKEGQLGWGRNVLIVALLLATAMAGVSAALLLVKGLQLMSDKSADPWQLFSPY